MPTRTTRTPSPPPEVVDPLWLVKAVALTLVAALLCGWFALCLLFYQGQWQFVLHPRRNAQSLSPIAGLPATPIRFDAGEIGVPRLSGALIPAAQPTRLAPYTVLYLRGGDASLAQSPADATRLALLHSLGLGIFAFDYRGFGSSDPTHPTLQRMSEDSRSALSYLIVSRGLPEQHILLYGTGVGASLATSLALAHQSIPALLLDAPGPPTLPLVLADPRTRALPVRWLFNQDFSLAGLATLTTPKLLISYPTPSSPTPAAFITAATPKTTLELPPNDADHLAPAISRFLDQYLVTPPATLPMTANPLEQPR